MFQREIKALNDIKIDQYYTYSVINQDLSAWGRPTSLKCRLIQCTLSRVYLLQAFFINEFGTPSKSVNRALPGLNYIHFYVNRALKSVLNVQSDIQLRMICQKLCQSLRKLQIGLGYRPLYHWSLRQIFLGDKLRVPSKERVPYLLYYFQGT